MKNERGVHVFRLFIWVPNSPCRGKCGELYTTYYLIESEAITGSFNRAIARSIRHGRGLRFTCNDRTDEVNNLFIMWPVGRFS